MQNPHIQGGHPQSYLPPSSQQQQQQQQQQYNQMPSQAALNSAFQNQGLPPHYGNPYGVPHQPIQPHHHYQNVIPQPQPIQPLSHPQPPLLSSSATASGLPLGAQSTSPEMYPGSGSKKKRSQVKNACINCQKACKKCDDGRPCSRCVKYGLSDTCQDSQRKERKKGIKRGPYKRRQNVNSLIAAGGQDNQHENAMSQQQDYQQHAQSIPFPYPAQTYDQLGYQYSRPHVESQGFSQQYSPAGYQQPMSSGLPMHGGGAGTTGGYPFMMPAQSDNFLTADQDHYQGGHHHHQQQQQSHQHQQQQQQQQQQGHLVLEQGIQPQPVGLTAPHNMGNQHMMLPISSASASGNGMGAAANHHANENGSIGGAALHNAVDRRNGKGQRQGQKLNVLSELCSAVLDKKTEPQPSPITESSPPIGSPLDAPELTPALTDATTSTSADEPKWDRPAGFPFSSKPPVSTHQDQYQWVGQQAAEHGGAVPLYMPHAMYS